MEVFQNEQLNIESLPKVADLEMHPLESRYKTVLIIGRCIVTVILGIAALSFFVTPIPDVPMIAKYAAIGLFVLITGWGFLNTVKGFHHKKYALRERDIVYSSGWLWKQSTIAPFNRVQHVSIDQGPIERQFNLSKLKIFTAGGKSSDMTVPGLSPETANALKEYIVQKTLDKTLPISQFTISDAEEE